MWFAFAFAFVSLLTFTFAPATLRFSFSLAEAGDARTCIPRIEGLIDQLRARQKTVAQDVVQVGPVSGVTKSAKVIHHLLDARGIVSARRP